MIDQRVLKLESIEHEDDTNLAAGANIKPSNFSTARNGKIPVTPSDVEMAAYNPD